MGISHIALAVKDIQATHAFYTEAMGFDLVKTEVVPKEAGGFARHLFYSTGSAVDQLIAFWDLANVEGIGEIKTDICRDLGHSWGTNHLAFQADDLDDLASRRDRLRAHGHDVLEIDHGWIHSIYAEDPDGITVEFATVTKPFTDADAAEAIELLNAANPTPSPDKPKVKMHPAATAGGRDDAQTR